MYNKKHRVETLITGALDVAKEHDRYSVSNCKILEMFYHFLVLLLQNDLTAFYF